MILPLDWIGGFFDGEGYANIYKVKYRCQNRFGQTKTYFYNIPQVGLCQNNRFILEEVDDTIFYHIGVRGYILDDKNTGVWKLSWRSRKARAVAKLLHKYTIVKRANLIKVMSHKRKVKYEKRT